MITSTGKIRITKDEIKGLLEYLDRHNGPTWLGDLSGNGVYVANKAHKLGLIDFVRVLDLIMGKSTKLVLTDTGRKFLEYTLGE